MWDENISKRPTSGKYFQLRQISEKAKEAIQNKELNNKLNNKINEEKDDKKVINELFNKMEKEISDNKEQISEKKFLNILDEESNKEAFNNILLNEITRIKNINISKTKLNDINLIEKHHDDLYDWTNLFNNSRPLSSYTTLKKQKLNKKEKSKIEEFKSPVVLVDLFEDQMNLYFGKNNFIKSEENNKKSKKKIRNKKKLSINIANNNTGNLVKSHKPSKEINIIKTTNNDLSSKNIVHNYIRPMSVYSPRENSFSFYFSSAFSDYYKEDLKTFSEKMKILKAKVKSNPKKLSHEIKVQRKISLKKEKKLNKILNLKQFNFGKDNLIIAADRKNPIPLLKSIFKQEYPNKEIMKENTKMYFNTMKPLGESDGPIDYSKNERWKLSELIAEMRDGKNNLKNINLINYNSFNNKNYRKKNNLVLSYYNKNDPYIKMFENIIKKGNIDNNKTLKENENDEINDKPFFNPILQNFNNNFTISFSNKNIEEKKINNENIENKINIQENIKIEKYKKDINIRPKTCFKLVGPNKNKTLIKRPLTSFFKKYNILFTNVSQEKRNSLPQNYIDPNSDFDYVSSNSFPLKTLSSVGNVSYDKINQKIQEKQFGLSKLKNDYFLTSTGQIKKKPSFKKYKEENIILDKINNIKNFGLFDNSKWNNNFNNKIKLNKKNKINFYNFDNIKDSFNKENKKDENFYTLNYFKNMGGKFYSSSNNVNVKNKRNKKIKLLNSLFMDYKYSRDDQEQEMDFVDEAVSSQTSSYQKI